MSLFHRKDSPYYWWKLQYKGEKFSKSTQTRNKSEAMAIFLENERLIKSGRYAHTEKTFGDLVAHYIDTYHPNEQATLRWALKFWADTKLIELRGSDIKQAQEFRAKKVKGSTVNRQFNTIRSILGKAVKNAANNWKDFKCDVDRVVKEEKLPAHIMRLVKWRFSNPPNFKYVEEHIGCITYFKKMEVK